MALFQKSCIYKHRQGQAHGLGYTLCPSTSTHSYRVRIQGDQRARPPPLSKRYLPSPDILMFLFNFIFRPLRSQTLQKPLEAWAQISPSWLSGDAQGSLARAQALTLLQPSGAATGCCCLALAGPLLRLLNETRRVSGLWGLWNFQSVPGQDCLPRASWWIPCLFVVCEAPHDSWVHDAVQEHGERVDGQAGVIQVLLHHAVDLVICQLHGLDGVLQGADFHLQGEGRARMSAPWLPPLPGSHQRSHVLWGRLPAPP